MLRPALIALALGLALAAGGPALAAPAEAPVSMPVQLKPGVMLERDVIRIGDLWDHAGDKADTPLVKAPDPGKRITFEARWLNAVAQAYGIDWRARSAFDRATVERSGRTLDLRLIETELREALQLEGAPANAQIDLPGRGSMSFMIPVYVEPMIGIRDLSYDRRMNRFSAVIEVPAGAPDASRFKISGSVFAATPVPVLTHAMGRGEIISDADIEMVEMREDVIRRDMVINRQTLVGQEVRFPVRAGAPIRVNDIQKPVVVPKNSAVTMVLRTPFMTLTAQGRSTEDGSVGDVIRVTNSQSKQVIDARVEGPGQVSVISPGQSAQAQ